MAVTFMATLLLAGCQKDSVTLRIRINNFGGNGKVYMDGYLPRWSSSEAFRINGELYQVSDINGDIRLTVPSTSSYSAFYPNEFYTSTSGNSINFTLPRVQYYELDGNNQLVKAPMAAYATAPSQAATSVPITFNNIGALLAINIENNLLPNTTTLTVDSVVVTTVGNTLPLWGTAVLPNITDPNSYYSCVIPNNAATPEKYYTVSVARQNGQPLFTLANGANQKVYVYIPSAEALSTNKFKIKVYAGNNTLEREQTSATGGLISHGMMATVPFEMRQVNAPTGAVPGGKFSVSKTLKVWFSAGNLQWKPTTDMGTSRASLADANVDDDRGEWRIAPNQWDFVGYEEGTGESREKWGTIDGSYNNGIADDSYAGWIDLFGWATSGYNAGSLYYHPYQYANATDYGPSSANSALTGTYANCDWGVYNTNTITYNGTHTTSSWRTLTEKEWQYLLGIATPDLVDARYNRIVNGNKGVHYCFSPAIYNYSNGDGSVTGILIYPDDYTGEILTDNDASTPKPSRCTITVIPQGCVFLPVTSIREGAAVATAPNTKELGYYWTVSPYTSNGTQAKYMGLLPSESTGPLSASSYSELRSKGLAVRLVTNVQ